MARVPSLLLALGTSLALGCGPSTETGAGVSSAPPQGADLMFDREGVPGPWWRREATLEMYETDLGVCLARGREARAGAEDPADAGYRGFLGCMQQLSWVRGLPPAPTAAAR